MELQWWCAYCGDDKPDSRRLCRTCSLECAAELRKDNKRRAYLRRKARKRQAADDVPPEPAAAPLPPRVPKVCGRCGRTHDSPSHQQCPRCIAMARNALIGRRCLDCPAPVVPGYLHCRRHVRERRAAAAGWIRRHKLGASVERR